VADRLYAGKNAVHPGYPVSGSMLLACWQPLVGVSPKTTASQSASETLIASHSPSPFPTQTPEHTKAPAENGIASITLVQSTPQTQTNSLPSSTPEDVPTDISEPSPDPIQITVQVTHTTSTPPTATDVVEAAMDTSDPFPGSTQITWMILLAMALIIFLLGGIIILRRTSLPQGRKSAERLDFDD
jgi:hypothetical protein